MDRFVLLATALRPPTRKEIGEFISSEHIKILKENYEEKYGINNNNNEENNLNCFDDLTPCCSESSSRNNFIPENNKNLMGTSKQFLKRPTPEEIDLNKPKTKKNKEELIFRSDFITNQNFDNFSNKINEDINNQNGIIVLKREQQKIINNLEIFDQVGISKITSKEIVSTKLDDSKSLYIPNINENYEEILEDTSENNSSSSTKENKDQNMNLIDKTWTFENEKKNLHKNKKQIKKNVKKTFKSKSLKISKGKLIKKKLKSGKIETGCEVSKITQELKDDCFSQEFLESIFDPVPSTSNLIKNLTNSMEINENKNNGKELEELFVSQVNDGESNKGKSMDLKNGKDVRENLVELNNLCVESSCEYKKIPADKNLKNFNDYKKKNLIKLTKSFEEDLHVTDDKIKEINEDKCRNDISKIDILSKLSGYRDISTYFPIKKPLKTIQESNTSSNSHKLKQTKIKFTKSGNLTFNTEENLVRNKFKSQIENFQVQELNDSNATEFQNKLIHQFPVEMIFNLIFSEGFCQLSSTSKNNTPIGIVIAVFWNLNKIEYHYFKPDNNKEKINLKKLFDYILNTNLICKKICYDTKIFYKFIYKSLCTNITVDIGVWDILVGSWLLCPEKSPGNFREVLEILKLPNNSKSISSDVIQNACYFINSASKAMEMLKTNLQIQKMWMLYQKIEIKITPILALMELRGVNVDCEILSSTQSILQNMIKYCETRSSAIAGQSFKLSSTILNKHLLYNKLKLDEGMEVPQMKSTNETALIGLKEFHPLPGIIIEYRKLDKIKSHIDPIVSLLKKDEILCLWDQTLSTTGRIISKIPNIQSIPKDEIFIGEGKIKKDSSRFVRVVVSSPKVQLMIFSTDVGEKHPLRLRGPFIARPDHTLLAIDFRHVEFRAFAHLAQDAALLDAINVETDIFENLAQIIFGPKNNLTDQRNKIKKIIYSMMYGNKLNELSKNLELDIEETKTILNIFSKKFPTFTKFTEKIIKKCRNCGYLSTISGRRRKFPNINSCNFELRSQSERLGIYFFIQGVVTDICKSAMIYIERILRADLNLKSHLLLHLHDGLVWEIHDEDVGNVADLILKELSNSENYLKYTILNSFNLPVAASTGKNWSKMIPYNK